MKNRFLLGSLFALLMVAILGASSIPQGWTLNSTLNAFQVLMKDGGGTKFVPAEIRGTWTPVITANSGAITSYTSVGKYVKTGGMVCVNGAYNITDNGTGSASGVISGLPFTATIGFICVMRMGGYNGYTATWDVGPGATSGNVWTYSNAYPWATSVYSTFSCCYLVF